ncbi:endonuclease/exonuclease/phosphatase family protein [Shewanella algidipiscicola]|uniref:UPF0294 protein n=1 Tax=Shewanella algidipiscicola TaxID=614070 RepID=A0ABQ4PM19_9GAMM|nr:endonuclease/exonuclease/phosphatase family protein [Shewanella algidipiscicola]GIU49169.1 UPF0294 protein [Shewanella algidipiscicola]
MVSTRLKVGLGALMLLVPLFYIVLVQQLNGRTEVMMSQVEPMFVSQCQQTSSAEALDRDGLLNIAVWNIYKQQKPQWQGVLQQLTAQNELVLLQEARLTHRFANYLQQQHVVMAKGFKWLNVPMGVMNLSWQSAYEACAFQAPEPLIRFAKSTLIAQYRLSNHQSLLVINLHGVNFDWRLDSYRAQWEQIIKKVALHQGPVVLAGDFNTWREGRLRVVEQLTERLKLKEAKYHIDHRHRVFGLPLDHLYYRGLTLLEAESFKTKASDHNPIVAKFTLIN